MSTKKSSNPSLIPKRKFKTVNLEELSAQLGIPVIHANNQSRNASTQPPDTAFAVKTANPAKSTSAPQIIGYPTSGAPNLVPNLPEMQRHARNDPLSYYLRPVNTTQVAQNHEASWSNPNYRGILSLEEAQMLLRLLSQQIDLYPQIHSFYLEIVFRPHSGGSTRVLRFSDRPDASTPDRYRGSSHFQLARQSTNWALRYLSDVDHEVTGYGYTPHPVHLSKNGGVYRDQWLKFAHLPVASGNFIVAYDCQPFQNYADHVMNVLTVAICALAFLAIQRQERTHYIQIPGSDDLQFFVDYVADEFQKVIQRSIFDDVPAEYRDLAAWYQLVLSDRQPLPFWLP